MSDFRELPAHHLHGLSDDELIGYTRRAREAGRQDAMKPAIPVLVHGYRAQLVNRARLKLASDADAEEVADEALFSAITSAFDGSSVGEFRSWMHTILSRRIADHYEARNRRVATTELPSEHVGDEDVWGREPSVPFEGEALFARECVERALSELVDARHRRVVELYTFGPHSAVEAAELAGERMTEANVHQIASRFQRRVTELLEGGGDTAG